VRTWRGRRAATVAGFVLLCLVSAFGAGHVQRSCLAGFDDCRVVAVTLVAFDDVRVRSLPSVAEEIGEQARTELDASGVTINRFVAVTQEWVTIANIGRLGMGEQRFPTDERYSRSRFAQITSQLERGEGYLAVQHAPECPPEIARILALFGKSSCVGVPLNGTDGRLWGELYATRDYGRPVFGQHELALATALAEEAGPRLAACPVSP
jgi:GAF domain-containing protein